MPALTFKSITVYDHELDCYFTYKTLVGPKYNPSTTASHTKIPESLLEVAWYKSVSLVSSHGNSLWKTQAKNEFLGGL